MELKRKEDQGVDGSVLHGGGNGKIIRGGERTDSGGREVGEEIREAISSRYMA